MCDHAYDIGSESGLQLTTSSGFCGAAFSGRVRNSRRCATERGRPLPLVRVEVIITRERRNRLSRGRLTVCYTSEAWCTHQTRLQPSRRWHLPRGFHRVSSRLKHVEHQSPGESRGCANLWLPSTVAQKTSNKAETYYNSITVVRSAFHPPSIFLLILNPFYTAVVRWCTLRGSVNVCGHEVRAFFLCFVLKNVFVALTFTAFLLLNFHFILFIGVRWRFELPTQSAVFGEDFAYLLVGSG